MHAYRYPAHERMVGANRPRARLRPGLGKPCRLGAHQARLARRHDGGRRLPFADSRALCRPGVARSRRRAHRRAGHVHDVVGRPHFGELCSPARTRSSRAPPGGVVAMARTGASAGFKRVIGFDMGGTSTDVAHFDGAVRARLRDRGRGRAHARADDEDPHRRRGRRLDPLTSTARAFASAPLRPAPIPARGAIAAAARSPSPTPT